MSDAPVSASPATGYRWIWIATVLGACAGFAYGVVHLIVLMLGESSGFVAARTPIGAILILIPVVAWVLSTLSAGGLVGLGSSAWLVARANEASPHPVRRTAGSLQRPLSWIALGTLAVAAATWIVWAVLDAALTLGAGLFAALWIPFVAWTALWLLVVLSAWQKLSERVAPSGDEWWQKIGSEMVESLPEHLAKMLWNAVAACVATGASWALFLCGTSHQIGREGAGMLGISAPTRTWGILLASAVLLQLFALAAHAWNLRGIAIGSLKRKAFDLALQWLPLDRLPQLPEAPELLRRALRPPSDLSPILRWLWKRAASKFEPALATWDRWSHAPDPRQELRGVLGLDDADHALLVQTASFQIVLAALWTLLV